MNQEMNKIVQVISGGDITEVTADALIATISLGGGSWFRPLHRAIYESSDNLFHRQINTPGLHSREIIIARSNGEEHGGAFKNVVFVTEELLSQISDIVYRGLRAASIAGFRSVSLPIIGVGDNSVGMARENTEEAIDEIVKGVSIFLREVHSIYSITFVCDDDSLKQTLTRAFAI